MTDPKRLLDGAGDDVEVALLAAGRDEQPSARAVEKTLLAIGAGSTVATTTAAATAAAELATAPAATAGAAAAGTAKAVTAGAAVAPLAAKASVPVLMAWTGVAAAGGLGTLTAIDYLTEPAEPAPMTAPASATGAERAAPPGLGRAAGPRPGAATAGEEPTEQASDEGEASAETEAPQPAHAAGGSDRQGNVGGADALRKRRLADEVAALDGARAALAAGNSAGALAALDDYDRSFDTQMLGPEAQTLRIEALLLAGRRGEARAAAARFLADHPSSTHGRRIRSLLEEPSATPAVP